MQRTIVIRNKQQLSENLLYVLVWVSILLVPVLNTELTSREHLYVEELFMSWLKTAPFLLIFLLHNAIVAPRALRSKRYGRYFVAMVVILLSIFGAVNFTQRFVLPSLEFIKERNLSHMTLTDIGIVWNLGFSLVMCSGNMGIKLIYKSMRDDQLMEELKHQNLRVEMEYLKYQINPHFFMNTLNNIHALIDIDHSAAKSAVIELSKMMRYVLYESGSESISLRQELQFVENYIELMSIRFDDLVRVNISQPERVAMRSAIPPLLLIVFVENAFKHGVRADGESFVDIEIGCTDETIEMTMRNSLSESRREGGGIGLINVRKRLELLYDERFELRCERRTDEYFVYLKIPNRDA
ncbi:MAG: histidine kinase [Rikenellaceae bacterium]